MCVISNYCHINMLCGQITTNTCDADHLFILASLHVSLVSFYLPDSKHFTGLNFHDIFRRDFPDPIRFNTLHFSDCIWDFGGVKRYKSLYTQVCDHARILENVQNGKAHIHEKSSAVEMVD